MRARRAGQGSRSRHLLPATPSGENRRARPQSRSSAARGSCCRGTQVRRRRWPPARRRWDLASPCFRLSPFERSQRRPARQPGTRAKARGARQTRRWNAALEAGQRPLHIARTRDWAAVVAKPTGISRHRSTEALDREECEQVPLSAPIRLDAMLPISVEHAHFVPNADAFSGLLLPVGRWPMQRAAASERAEGHDRAGAEVPPVLARPRCVALVQADARESAGTFSWCASPGGRFALGGAAGRRCRCAPMPRPRVVC